MDCPARQWCDYFTNTKLQTFVGQSPRDYKDHDLKAVTWNNIWRSVELCQIIHAFSQILFAD